MSRLDRVVESLRKDSIETQHNTRRIAANLPLIERKLDIVAGDTNYKLEFPITERSHAVNLNIQIKPDNCCDCLPGAEPARRYMTGFPDYFWYERLNIIHHPSGHPELDYYPPHPAENGADYPAYYHAPLDTQGSITNIWFAWEGYPWFYPTVENNWAYGQFAISPETGGIRVPVNGVYSMIFRNRAGGSTTDSSQIVASIKRLPKEKIAEWTDLDNWETISRKIYSVVRENICTYLPLSWALIWGWNPAPEDIIEVGGGEYAKCCASYGRNIGFNPTVIDRIGGLYIEVYAYCVPLNEGDIIGGWLMATDVNGWSQGEGGADYNNTMIDLIGLGFGALTGKVTYDNTGQPLEGVKVVCNNGTTWYETLTNDEGRYVFYDLTPDLTYTVTISKSGYFTQSKSIKVVFNVLRELDFIILHVP